MVNSRILKSINFIVDVVVVIVVVNVVVVALLIVTSHIIATLGLHLGFSARLRIWQVSAYKMEPRSGSIIIGPATQPPTQPSTELVICNLAPVQKVCEVSPPHCIGTLFKKYVRCPPLPVYTFSVRCYTSNEGLYGSSPNLMH